MWKNEIPIYYTIWVLNNRKTDHHRHKVVYLIIYEKELRLFALFFKKIIIIFGQSHKDRVFISLFQGDVAFGLIHLTLSAAKKKTHSNPFWLGGRYK